MDLGALSRPGSGSRFGKGLINVTDAISDMKVLKSTSVSWISCAVIDEENIARRNAGKVTCAIACCKSTSCPVSAHRAQLSTRPTNSSAITSATRAR